jgi:CBS domain-containing protein
MLAEVKSADIMRKGVAWALPDDTVEKIVNIMQQQDTGYVMIGESGRLQGIVSKSDVRGAMSPYLQSMFVKWRGPMDTATLQIKAKWIMSRPVRTVRPDTNIGSIMRAMMDHGGRCVPVVDDQAAVIGTVNVFDIFRALTLGPGPASVGVSGQTPPLA